MPSLFKKRLSKNTFTGGISKRKSNKSSIFRLKEKSIKKTDPPCSATTEGQQELLDQPGLTWTSSFESIAESHGDIESLYQFDSEEVSVKFSLVENKANHEALQMDTKKASDPRENEIIQKIDSLCDSLAKAEEIYEDDDDEEEESSKDRAIQTILSEDYEYQQKYETAQTIIDRQELDILHKSEEISHLQNALRAQEADNANQQKYETAQTIINHQEMDILHKAEKISHLKCAMRAQEVQHDAKVKLLLAKLLEREQEIETLQEKVNVASQLVFQTASRLLKQQHRKGNTPSEHIHGILEYWMGSSSHTKTT